MFKITYGLLEFPMKSTFTHPRGHTYKLHQQRCCAHRPNYLNDQATKTTVNQYNKTIGRKKLKVINHAMNEEVYGISVIRG